MKTVTTSDFYSYPWGDLETDLATSTSEVLPLIGYGSLLNLESAARTIDVDDSMQGLPVVAFGVKRVFNYIIPATVVARYYKGKLPDSLQGYPFALNVVVDPDGEDLINGRLFFIRIEDVEGLRSREFGYDLIKVPYAYWNQRENIVGEAYVLSAKEKVFDGRQILSDSGVPFAPYVQVCLLGAGSVSAEFLKFFMSSTYMPDQKTLVE